MRRASKSILGLDIGQHSVKAVVASANGAHLRVHRAEEIPLPLNAAETGSTLRKWTEEQGLSRLPVVSGVGGGRVLYQHLRMDPDDPREPEQVGQMEAIRFSEMTDAQMEVSVTPASRVRGEKDLMLCMARPEHLAAALEPLTDAGLQLVNACPAPVALYNGITALGEPVHQPTLFVDLGAGKTEMVVGDGQGVRFARSFAMGTALLSQTLAGRAKCSFLQAERTRLQAGSFSELAGDMDEVCVQFVRQWIREIESGLQLYRETPAGRAEGAGLRRMMLSGGGAEWAPLRQAITTGMSLSVSAPGALPGIEQVPSGLFIGACGLAADGLGIGRATSSLLTPQIRQSLNRRRNKRYWGVTGVFAVGTLAMVGAATEISFRREQTQLRRQNEILQRSDAIRQESEALLRKKQQVARMIQPVADFVTNSARVRDLTLRIARDKGPEDFITFLGDSESYLQLRLDNPDDRDRRAASPRNRLALQKLNRQEAESLRSARMNRLIVEGFTPGMDLATVKALIESLNGLDEVDSADLLSDDFVFADPERDREWRSTGFRRFVLDVRFTVDAALREVGP